MCRHRINASFEFLNSRVDWDSVTMEYGATQLDISTLEDEASTPPRNVGNRFGYAVACRHTQWSGIFA